jgi:hypothetical protein
MTPRTIHALLCVAIAAAACDRVPKADRDAALDTVRRNVRLTQEETIEEMMETIHPKSPAFEGTRTAVTELAKEFDLRCELTAVDVIGGRRGEVRVRFEQITERKKDGIVEPKTRLVGVHVLRKDDGAWKIFDTEVISADVVDPPPEDAGTVGEK